jgi:predicted dehydrogenase
MLDTNHGTQEDKMTVRIGIIGTANGHAAVVAGFLNGWSEEAPTIVRAGGYLDPYYHFWQYQRMEEVMATGSPTAAPTTRVTKIWGEDRDLAARIAFACDIPELCQSVDDACVDVDAVMVLSGDPEEQPRQAAGALERGLPTFIDKPLASNVEACKAVFAQARRTGAPVFSGSGLRWSSELQNAKRDFTEGFSEPIEAIYVKVPNRVEQYGIHAVEMANIFLGADVRRVSAIQDDNRCAAILSYATGQTALVEMLNAQIRPSYCVIVYGQRHTKMVHLYDTALGFIGLFDSFLSMVSTRVAPVAEAEVVRLMEIVFAVQDASALSKSVDLPPYGAPL